MLLRFTMAIELLRAATCCAVALWTAPAYAAEPLAVKPSGAPLFKDFDPGAELLRNVSGITCFPNNICIAVADEMIAIQAFSMQPSEGGATYIPGRHYAELFAGLCRDIGDRKTCDEVDLEGIARQGRNVLVTGSMGNKSKSGKKAKKRWFLAQFAVDDSGNPLQRGRRVQSKRALLKRLFKDHEAVDRLVGKPLQCDGLNIEGLAQIGERVFFGLRGPADRQKGEAMIIQSDISILDAREPDDVAPTKLFRLTFRDDDGKALTNIGIRALETHNERLLIATGDSGVAAPAKLKHLETLVSKCTRFAGNVAKMNIVNQAPMQPRIWIWDPASGADPVEVMRIDGALGREKLEGIAVIGDQTSPIDLLLSFDGLADARVLSVLRDVAVPETR